MLFQRQIRCIWYFIIDIGSIKLSHTYHIIIRVGSWKLRVI